MASLSTELRNQLERAVKNARDIAEQGARAAIEQLAVHEYEPYQHLTPDQRELRNRLRARARQLGDTRDQSGRHGIGHLVVETAYEHWHRMLFARFLAENNVLMHPEGMPVTLEECDELAPDEGAADGWELASWYAAEMLPQIFRPGSPVFELKLPRERVQKLERLLDDLPPTVFHASDSLGWVYQFWQAKKKDEVNASEVKIGADEISAVTQLFTEPYMVDFLLQNTLGAWWVGRHGKDSLPVEMPYLRFLDDGTPAAGTFDGWPKTTAEVKVLDPCCGSGHFLVAAFNVLVRFRMAEEGLSAADACEAVLRDNLHGLEIDERCTQIAVFALALAAWTFEGCGDHRPLPDMHVACSGLAPHAKKSEWLGLAGSDVRLRNGMDRLHGHFQEAPTLGSLIDPNLVGMSGRQQRELGVAQFHEISPMLEQVLTAEHPSSGAVENELRIAARGIVAAATILGRRFDLVFTNVPYLSRGKQSESLRRHCDHFFQKSKTDLATVFLERMLDLLAPSGTIAMVAPQNWRFQATYEDLRKHILRSKSLHLMGVLGKGAFDTISGEVVNVALFVVGNQRPDQAWQIRFVDASASRSASIKAKDSRDEPVASIAQFSQLKNPAAAITLNVPSSLPLLEAIASSYQGIKTGDDGYFRRCFWEFPRISDGWRCYQSTVSERCGFGGLQYVLRWEDEGRALARRQGLSAWGHRGIAISQMSGLPASIYLGGPFDSNMSAIVPRNPSDLNSILAYCFTDEYVAAVRSIDRALKPTNSSLVRVPFDAKHWSGKTPKVDGQGLPASADPTQWAFSEPVASSLSPLQVGAVRLLGYAWPEQSDDHLASLIDDDGIVCLPALRGELPAATRLQSIFARAYGDDWSPHILTRLLEEAGSKGWTLDRWLADKFFEQHCKLFGNRPFIWHIWDGLKGGFSALVNYHKLNRPLLETLTFNYLGDWIRQQQAGGEGNEERLAAAEALQTKLKLILDGEAPHDIFVRWKALADQPIGWAPDLNDGVRMNIRPFMTVPDVGKKGAGILRAKPNIKWGKDRGKDPGDAPWYELGPEYGGKPGDRINDHHLTLAEKQTARRGGA